MMMIIIIIIIIITTTTTTISSSSLCPLCRVFIHIFLRQTMSLGNTMYSVSAILSLLFMVPISLVPALALLYFYLSTFRSMCAVPNKAVFCSSFTSWFPGCCLCIFYIILKWSQSLLLLLVSPLFLPSTCVVFLLSGPYILKSSPLPF